MQRETKCKYCNNKAIKKGIRKNKLTAIQNYYCKKCKRKFSEATNKTYPIKIMLTAISFYNRGYSLDQTKGIINRMHKIKLSKTTIHRWIKETKQYCTINRKKAIKICKPKEMLQKQQLNHQQAYIFQCHNAKIELLKELTSLENNAYEKIKQYFNQIQSKEYPHHYFGTSQRGSQIQLALMNPETKTDTNNANLLALKALTQITNNYHRHKAIQDFMLSNDTSTIATEIPVYLTEQDIQEYQNRQFKINALQTPITGHIDFIQIRNNLIYILDYKPEADKTKPTQQLTIYALALAARLKLPVKQFRCAWFDENNYYEFMPLACVREKTNLAQQNKIE